MGVKLLEAQPEVSPGAPPEPPRDAPQEAPAADPAARACTSCGAAMDSGQDWCLACGQAAAPLTDRPGWRSAMTVLGITLVLVMGAVGAAFAALSDDPGPATASSTPQVAAVPSATPAPPAPAATPGTETTPATGSSTLPKVDAPSSGSSAGRPRTAPTPSSPSPSPQKTPAPAPAPAPSTSSGSSGASGASGGSDTSGSSSGSASPGASTGGSTSPAPSAPVVLDVAAEEVAIYDPYQRAANAGDPARAVDGDSGTSWLVEPPAGSSQVNVGYAIDLGRSRGVRSVEISTLTPGFKVEVYATDEATPPPNILDSRWAHITDKDDVGTTERIVLGAGSSKYRMVMLWITQPPSDGTRVRISELELRG